MKEHAIEVQKMFFLKSYIEEHHRVHLLGSLVDMAESRLFHPAKISFKVFTIIFKILSDYCEKANFESWK